MQISIPMIGISGSGSGQEDGMTVLTIYSCIYNWCGLQHTEINIVLYDNTIKIC